MRMGPRGVPVAYGMEIKHCDDPTCGPHICGTDQNGVPEYEIVLSLEATRRMVDYLHKFLYGKAVEQDGPE